MRTVDPELQARLDGGATRLCRCWRVRRSDGAELGFTDHDLDLSFGGPVYKASSGMDATALETATGLSVDNAQAMGALSDASVSEEDVRAGRYDDAEIFHWLVDWERPELRLLQFRGRFGEIRRADGGFEVELRGLAEPLNAPVGRSILRRCDRVLGDSKCGVDLQDAAYSAETEVMSADGGRIVAAGLGGFADGWFAQGTLAWLSGGNVGGVAIVKSDKRTGERMLELWQQPPRPVATGDRFKVVAGCDKTFETCGEKFGNRLNFRGFPHIPGEDWVTAYPKDGAIHDGASLQEP